MTPDITPPDLSAGLERPTVSTPLNHALDSLGRAIAQREEAARLDIPAAVRRGEWPSSTPQPHGYTERLHLTDCEAVHTPTTEALHDDIRALALSMAAGILTAAEQRFHASLIVAYTRRAEAIERDRDRMAAEAHEDAEHAVRRARMTVVPIRPGAWPKPFPTPDGAA